MNKLDDKSQATSFAISTASQSEPSTPRHSCTGRDNASLYTSPEPAHRLIVLVPTDSDYTDATRRVWELAHVQGAHVLFIGLCKDAAQEPGLRRQLVTMSAMVQDPKVSAEAKVEIGTNWVGIVKTHYQAGDMIVCSAEQRAGLLHKPLSQILEANLNTSVYVISGLHRTNNQRSSWLSTFTVWAGSIGLILGFFWLQTRITQLPQDWAHTAMLYLSVFVELGLVWGWNSLFS